jgi:hypothetical protein
MVSGFGAVSARAFNERGGFVLTRLVLTGEGLSVPGNEFGPGFDVRDGDNVLLILISSIQHPRQGRVIDMRGIDAGGRQV